MSEDVGKCPGCNGRGPVGEACSEKACRKRDYRFIPTDYWEDAHNGDGELVDPMVGQTVGDFLVVGVLGSGGFGTVYLAVQKPLFRLRGALKLIEPPEDNDEFAEVMLEKFQGEAEVLADLSHPNIVRLIKYGIHQRRPYLVMEYVEDGVTLRQEIHRRARAEEPFSHEELRHVFTQILDGLEAAHDRDIIHRDVKPENIMLQPVVGDPAHVRILDFGLAKVVDERSDTDWMLGSPSYMAPEQVNRENLGTWTDLYGLGVMFFELVTGRKPFPGDTDAEIVALKFDDEFDPFEEVRQLDLDDRLLEFMQTALCPDPEGRFETVPEFRTGLERALDAMEREEAGTVGPGSADLTMLVDSADILEVVDPDDDGSEGGETPPPLEAGEAEADGGEVVDRTAGGVEEADSGAEAESDEPGGVGRGLVVFAVGAGLVAALGLGVYVGQGDFAGELPGVGADDIAGESGEGSGEGDSANVATRVDSGGQMAGASGTAALDVGDTVEGAGRDAARDAADERDAADTDVGADAGDVAAAVPPETFVGVSAGKYHSCALRADERLHCWGGNFEGELGLGHTETIGDDEPASAADPLTFDASVEQFLAVGDRKASFSCVLLGTGDVTCWGANSDGQLGYGEESATQEPVLEPGEPAKLGADAVEIAAGASKFGSHVCARLEAGGLKCWGNGKFGKLGYGHTNIIGDDEAPSTAGRVAVGGDIREVAAGKYNTCVILKDGRLRCWGWNRHGQLGLGHTDDIGDDELPVAEEPVEVGGEPTQISIGRRHVCARMRSGDVRCWGWNKHGQLGLGHTDDVGDDEAPADAAPVELDGPVERVAAGGIHTCALLESGDVQCWGDNRFGQLGLGHEKTVGDDEVPTDVGTLTLPGSVEALACGKFHTCVALESGDVRCWGLNKFGQLGYGHTNHIGNDEPPASVAVVPLD